MNKPQSSLLTLFKVMGKLPLPLLQSFGYFLALIFYHLTQAKTLQCARLNLKIALPELSEEQFKVVSKQATINEVRSYFEFLSIWSSTTETNLSRIHSITGEQYFHDALAEQKGLVLIIPHFGTWEVMNAWLSQSTTMTIMYKPSKNIAADTFVKNARSREHAHLVPTNESGIREIFKALKQGGTTIILPDHSPDQGSDLTSWFGIPLYSSHLSAKLIKKTKAKTLFLYAIRNDNAGFDMHIEPIDEAIYTHESGTEVIHAAIENLIKKHPEHYHWSYKRFKASPETRQLYNISQDEALQIIQNIRNKN